MEKKGICIECRYHFIDSSRNPIWITHGCLKGKAVAVHFDHVTGKTETTVEDCYALNSDGQCPHYEGAAEVSLANEGE